MTQDVVIVGAPRSGTNMLRDVLTRLDDVATWPCDEINLVWRHGNRDVDSDELPPSMARPQVAAYIRSRFGWVRQRYAAATVVEKTCATSLRVAFTHRVLPHAKYVFIVRDGVDAAASAMARWHAPLDLRYTAAKARFVPASDLPYYGARFLSHQLGRRRTAGTDHVTTWWGPRPADYEDLMRERPLDEICMKQWQRCVEKAARDLGEIPRTQVTQVSYETFVRQPIEETARLAAFLGLEVPQPERVVGDVSGASIGKGRQSLGPDGTRRLALLASETLQRFGYAG